MIGKKYGQYEILDDLGAGGMGEVYLARDTKLGREVAVKALPLEFAGLPEFVQRFRREAKVLASLNHPNVAAVYDVVDTGDRPLLVMEFVSGPTLAERIAEGSIPVSEALGFARQMADALEDAHAKGIVHRDLKPANVKIAGSGHLKILDFGLAKVMVPPPAEDPADRTLPAGSMATVPGTILGTPNYMSPEQARGEALDERTDLWSLGCVFYEMLTGGLAFPGNSFAEIMAAVLARDPDWRTLPGDTPPEMVRLLQSCLAKDPNQRVHRARSVADEIRRAETGAGTGVGVGPSASPRLSQITYAETLETSPVWSPDGESLLFTRQTGPVRKLFQVRVSTGESFAVTRGDHDDLHPAWDPNHRRILFVRSRVAGRTLQPGDVFGTYGAQENVGDIWEADLQTGKERLLVENAYHPSVSPDGARIAFDAAWTGPCRIWVADAQGRNAQQVTSDTSEAVSHLRPRWSPDGKKIVFQNKERTQFDIRSVELENRKLRWITRDLVMDVQPVWSPDGNFVYFTSYRSGGMNLWRVPVDRHGAASGSLRQVTTGAGQDLQAAISPDGKRLAFSILNQNSALWRLPVSPESGGVSGPPEALVSSTREDSRGAWSPDDSAIAFNSNRKGSMNLWLYHIEGGELSRLTSGEGGDYQPTWSPDGKTLVFFSSRNGNPGIWKLDLATEALISLSPPDRVEVNPFFSPDGTRIGYHSDRDGRLELWVMDADGGNPRQLTRIGVMGHFLRWSRDGQSIYFRGGSRDQLVHRISAEGGEPQPLRGVTGGSHISLNPQETRLMDVIAHQVLWVSDLDRGEAEKVFEFEQSDVRIDYPVWSHRGDWLLFDRFSPRGGDIWMMENFV